MPEQERQHGEPLAISARRSESEPAGWGFRHFVPVSSQRNFRSANR